nr:copia protein [Tanacetum cinerariifolium]
MRIPLLYQGEYSQWRKRFMNYLEEKTDGEAMINSIQNGDHSLPVVAQVSLAGTAPNATPTLKDPKQMRGSEYGEQDRKAAILYEQTKNLMDINIDSLYNILKQNLGDVNDALGYKKKAVVVTSDPLALVAEKTKVSKQKEKVEVQTESEGSDDEDITSSSANKKLEYVKSVEKKEDKKFDEKKRDMSKVNYGLSVNDNDDQEIFHDAIESASENFIENHIYYQKDCDDSEVNHNDSEAKDHLVDKLIQKFNHKIDKCQKRIEKANQQSKDLENQNKGLQYKYDILITQVNTFEEKNNEFNEQMKVLNENNADLLAQTDVLQDQLKVKHVVIDTHTECFESSENAISESENQSENDCQVVEKGYDQVENSKVIVPGMFKLNVSQNVSPILVSKTSCASKNVETKTKRKRGNIKSSKQNDKQVNNDVLRANREFVHFSDLDTFSSVRRTKHSGVIWKKKWSSNTSNVDLSYVSHSKLNKDVKRYSRKDLLSCNNSHLGETSSSYDCNDAMNVSCNSRLCDTFDENNLFIFDDESICLWIIGLGCSKHMMGNRALLTNFVEKFLGTVHFGNNDFAMIAGYGDIVIGSMTIKKVYYVKGLRHNLFSVGQFCYKGLKVTFQKSACFVRNEDGVDLLTSNRSSNLYTIALKEVASNSSTCLLAKASSSQSWLWHQRLSHLNFATINNLVKNNLVQCLPKMKFEKDHLCSTCKQGKIHRNHHKSKTALASNKPLYLLHKDLCGPMCVEKESSSSSLNDDVQQSLKEVRVPLSNTQSISNDMVPNVDEASTSHNVFNERLKDAYFDAIGYSQQEGIDYDETFTPVARIEAIRLFLAYADHKDFTVFQMDVKTEFLNRILKEEVYVGQTLGFVSKQYPDHVYAPDKALYGFKQAPRAWYDVLLQFLIESGFQKVESEYVVVSGCCAQLLWMRTQLMDYGFFYDKVPIYCDSKSAIVIPCNSVQHTRTKHIDVRYHFIKDHVKKGTIELYFVGTKYQLADLFTKSLPKARFKFLVEKLGMMSRET